MAQFKFDPTINAGHVVTFATMIAGGIAAFYNVKGDLSIVDQRLKSVEIYMARMTDMLVSDAGQNARIMGLEKRVDRLESSPPRPGQEVLARP